jgi:hypothetical protein
MDTIWITRATQPQKEKFMKSWLFTVGGQNSVRRVKKRNFVTPTRLMTNTWHGRKIPGITRASFDYTQKFLKNSDFPTQLVYEYMDKDIREKTRQLLDYVEQNAPFQLKWTAVQVDGKVIFAFQSDQDAIVARMFL